MTAIQWVSREESLQSEKFPVFIRRMTHTYATARVAHDASKIMLVNSGSSILSHEAGTLNIYAGQVVLLPHGHWYSGAPSGFITTTTAYIDTSYLREHVRWLPEPFDLISTFAAHEAGPSPLVLNSHLHDISRLDVSLRQVLMEQTYPGSGARSFTRVAEVFDALTRGTPVHDHRPEPIRRAVSLIHDNLAYGWTLETLANAVALSKSQLTRLFAQTLKIGPAEFLRQTRGQRMAELLATTTQTIESIAQQVGWEDASHASRAFRSVIGLSPLQYRTMSREERGEPENGFALTVEAGRERRDHQQPTSDDGRH